MPDNTRYDLKKRLGFIKLLMGLAAIMVIGFVFTFVDQNPTHAVRKLTKRAAAPVDNDTLTSKAPNVRLPDHTRPINYKLDMRVFFDVTTTDPTDQSNDHYEAQLKIDIEVVRPTNEILFHKHRKLNILNTITITNQETRRTIKLRKDQHGVGDFELYWLRFDKNLPAGKYRLKLDYTGAYGSLKNIDGFYKTRYKEDGIIKQMIATKFQPTKARKAFPCFDEPALKATFQISIEHPARTKAISNWPEISKKVLPNGRIKTKFDKTFPMCTYLAAWAIVPEDFAFKETTSKNGIRIRVHARKNAVQAGLVDFAVEMSKNASDFFENVYFDSSLRAVPPKIDMIGFPDFASGAMEHWGAVGYRETALLNSDKTNAVTSKQYVAFIVSHELAHFWFGNLVTCSWWNDLWLNEAMARFLQFKSVQHIHPKWDVKNQFLTLYEIPVMYEDGFRTSQPISVEVNSPAQINSLFSPITYDKGSSILRMLESTVGPDNFREGLNNYLKKNQFNASVAADFYSMLKLPSDMAPHITPTEYMDRWLKVINYPLVTVKISHKEGKTRVDFSQKRFVFPKENQNEDDDYIWPIYLKCMAGGIFPDNHLFGMTKKFTVFMNEKSMFTELDRDYSWVKCNENFGGFYVTEYSCDQFEVFEKLLNKNPKLFTKADRANLINDAFTLSYSGLKPYSLPVQMTNHFKKIENDYVVWRTFTLHITRLATLLQNRPSLEQLKELTLFRVRPLLKRLNVWENSGSHTELLQKISILELLCLMDDEQCLENASKIFKTLDPNYFTNPRLPNNIPPNFRSIVYRYHMQNSSDKKDFKGLFNLYVNSFDPQEKLLALNALAETQMIWLLEKLFDTLLEPSSHIRPQDFFALLVATSRNPSARLLLWSFLQENWETIADMFGYSSRAMAKGVKSITRNFETEELLEEMRTFFQTTKPGAGLSQRNQALDIVEHNVWWMKNIEPDFREHFSISVREECQAS